MKTSKNQAVMPINVAAMIDENDPVFNRKSYSKTDREATFMRMKDDHMGNGQLKPGYNLQICVESEYIVGLGLFSNPTDTTTLIPFLERTAEGTGRRHGNIVADAGYASEENYTYLESTEQNAYIKPADHELKKTRKFKKNIYHKDDMPCNAESDSFTCPNDKRLLHAYDRTGKTDNGYMILESYYVCEECSGCSRRENCFKGQYENRKTELSKTMRRQKNEAEKRISTDRGILHEPASLEPKNVMFGTPRIALLKKERG